MFSGVQSRLHELNELSDQVTSLQTKIGKKNNWYNILSFNDDYDDSCYSLRSPPAELNSSKKELVKSQEELRPQIEHLFTGSLSELQQKHDDHRSQVERNGRQLKDVRSGSLFIALLYKYVLSS